MKQTAKHLKRLCVLAAVLLADANLDGELNITDVTALIDRLLAAQ